MTTPRLPWARPQYGLALILLGLVGALVVATLGQKAAMIAIGVPVAIAAIGYIVRRPLVMVVAMVVIEASNMAFVVAERSPIPVFQVSIALGVLTVVLALRDPLMRGRLNRGTLVCVGLYGCFFLTQVVATFTSQDVEASLVVLKAAAVDGIFFVVVLLLTQLTARPWTVAAALVVPLAVISVLCLISLVAFNGAVSFGGFASLTDASGELITTPRFGGPGMDPNFWGRNLILGLPLAGALIVRGFEHRAQRAVVTWTCCLLALLVGVYLTQSRGTMLATVVVFVVWVLASGRLARRRGLMSLPLLALLLLVPGVGNRLLAVFTDVSGAPPVHVDPSVLGRMAAGQSAWAMFWDRPILGNGPNSFASMLPQYAGLVPTAVLHPPDAPHNLYAQLAAESGIVGLAGWAVFLGGFVVLLSIRITRLAAARQTSGRSLAAALMAAIVGWSLASVFLHMASFRTFAIVLALSGALAFARQPDPPTGLLDNRTAIRDAIVGMVCGLGVAAAILAATGTETYYASTTVTILPAGEMRDSSYAYALDLKSREPLLPTYAAMMVDGSSGASAVADNVRGVITISVADTSGLAALDDLDEVMTSAHARLSEFGADAWYTLTPVGSREVEVRTTRSPLSTGLAAIAGLGVAVGMATALRRRSGRRVQLDDPGGQRTAVPAGLPG